MLFHLCRHCVGVMEGWAPYPAWAIAKCCNISVSTARRRLRELKKQGLAETCCLRPNPEDEYLLPYYGWRITDKAEETEEYKTAYEREMKICREVFGTNMFPEEWKV